MEQYVTNIPGDNFNNKLEIIKKLSIVLENYYSKDYPMHNLPFRDYIIRIVNNIKVGISLEKGKQYTKNKKNI